MKYFALRDFWFSATAIRNQIDNKPKTEQQFNKLIRLGQTMDIIRERIGKPINITSGYRCLQLNRLCNSKDTSQHIKCQACDFQVIGYSNAQLFDLFKQLAKGQIVQFDQLIWEYNSWIHLSISDNPRHQCLVINRVGTTIYETE